MRKTIIFGCIFAIFCIAGAAFFAFSDFAGYQKRELIKDFSPLACDLNASECTVKKGKKSITFNLSPKPLEVLTPLRLQISGLGEVGELNAKFYGLNMYMGDIVSEFEKKGEIYESELILSTCTEDKMRYRLELFSGEKPLGIFIDFDVKR